ncbi:hypothetical protein LOK49_LG01G03133 [Camellia lanceoleosa]|uniref:Uncharacterized protein n=1 Tax=Camellia lanceoleosa TaxID=1840588 RepID=A0ACC0J347_9ERIC|nr:hypothetical protein LOK49_LG01G03133 [Camellia lanceoleosa]
MAEREEDGHGEGRRMAEGGDGTVRGYHCDDEAFSVSHSHIVAGVASRMDKCLGVEQTRHSMISHAKTHFRI